jgi:hypothetical protein
MQTQPAIAPETTTPKKKQVDIKDVAKKALEDADGDVQKGVARMVERVRKNRALFTTLMDPLVESACFREIGMVCRRERRDIWRAPNYGPADEGARVIQLAAGNLLMFPLPGGKPLGEATKEDVEKAAHFYREQSNDMGHKARWLQIIADRTPPERLVQHVLSDEELRSLQEQTK